MRNKASSVIGPILLLALAGGLVAAAMGQSVSDFAVQASATVQTDPPWIQLIWQPVDNATGCFVYRKSPEDASWGPPTSLPGNSAVYIDLNAQPGIPYEYQILRKGTNYESHAYLYAGIGIPMTESRGKILLIVDNTCSESLATELKRLQQDLVGDGWTVLRRDVPRMAIGPANEDPRVWTLRSNEVASVKSLIKADYLADPTQVKAVFLFGHVPVPYSGALAPDDHADHLGAWPADLYYADMAGIWTDSNVDSTTAADSRNHNVPGDGKFDQSFSPAKVTLEIGRVDLANMDYLPLSELELLRQYLNKDHDFRHKVFTAQTEGFIDDNFGILGSEAPAANGWTAFASLVGAGNVATGRWLTALPRGDYLWSYGAGAGTYTGASGVIDTMDFAAFDTQVVFTMLFGSYFGDWDSANNLLRAPLAAASRTLTAVWAGRPYWFFQHMALGETIGFSTRVSQNNTGLYLPTKIKNGGVVIGPVQDPSTGVHIALMGDPTLRMQAVAPPFALLAVTNSSGGVNLTWSVSTNEVLGYYLYRAPSPDGPYSRLNAELITGNAFIDPTITSDRYYMVRASTLEISSSGTYYNLSQGVFGEAALASFSTDVNTWAGRDTGLWKFTDVAGSGDAGPGWDQLQISGTLNITATSSNLYTVKILSLQGDHTLGAPANFDNNRSYAWPILTASDGIVGFDPAKINLVTTDFQADLAGGVFSLALSEEGKSIILVFTPNYAPVANSALFNRIWDVSLRLSIADLLSGFTSDPNGDARALVQVGSSTNGTAISTVGNTLVFASTNNLTETVSYWIQDVRNYRPGDTIRTARGTITVQPLPKGLQFNAYHAIEIEWTGESGRRYQVQSRLETESDWVSQGDPIMGTGVKASLFERATGPTKFYRIVLIEQP